jgi:hypothetical protein
MLSANKRLLLLAGSVALAAVVAVAVGRRKSTGGTSPGSTAAQQQRRYMQATFSRDGNDEGRDDEAGSGLAYDAGGADVVSISKTADTVMAQWRNGILLKDTDAVLAADAVFRQEPARFLEALMRSAETDSDERVRAFSTRVLGKLVDPACAPLLTRLLDDKSQYVRTNAAWALGELAATPEGRAAAAPALRSLRRLEEREPAKDAREAASLAARKLM